MPAGKYNFTIEQGTKFSRDFAWKNADRTPVNISGYSFRMMARHKHDDALPIISLSTFEPPGGISIVDGQGRPWTAPRSVRTRAPRGVAAAMLIPAAMEWRDRRASAGGAATAPDKVRRLEWCLIGAVVFISQLCTLPLWGPGSFPPIAVSPWYIESQITPFQRFMAELDPVLIALILFSWMSYARMVHANVVRLKYQEYVVAARALGANGVWVLLRHLLPNAITPAIVLAARDIGGMVVLQTTFSFIGLGASSPWGVSLNLGRAWVLGVAGNPLTYWWAFVPATLALILFGLSWNLVGDALSDWVDPHHR